MSTPTEVVDTPGPAPRRLPRVLSGGGEFGPATLGEHIECFGRPPGLGRRGDRAAFVDMVERSGLRGRGGGAFPTGVKLRAVAQSRRRPVVVANGAEGEPLSAKDKPCLRRRPISCSTAPCSQRRPSRADDVIVVVDRTARDARVAVENAIEERRAARMDPVSLRTVDSPTRYLAGEESALVHWLNGGPAKPTFVPPRPFERGVGGRATLVQNVETLAHIALIARFGDSWFRSIGSRSEPGSALVTVGGAVTHPGVLEISLGTQLATVIQAAGGVTEEISAFLVGGYFGTWLRASDGSGSRAEHRRRTGGRRRIRLRGGRGTAGDELRTHRDGWGDAVPGRGDCGSVRTVRARIECDRAMRSNRSRTAGSATARSNASTGGSATSPAGALAITRTEQSVSSPARSMCSPTRSTATNGTAGADLPRGSGRCPSRIRRIESGGGDEAADPSRSDRGDGHGVCAELFPERVRLDDWGYPILDPTPIPSELRDHAQRAVTACPNSRWLYTRTPSAPLRRRGSSAPPGGARGAPAAAGEHPPEQVGG